MVVQTIFATKAAAVAADLLWTSCQGGSGGSKNLIGARRRRRRRHTRPGVEKTNLPKRTMEEEEESSVLSSGDSHAYTSSLFQTEPLYQFYNYDKTDEKKKDNVSRQLESFSNNMNLSFSLLLLNEWKKCCYFVLSFVIALCTRSF